MFYLLFLCNVIIFRVVAIYVDDIPTTFFRNFVGVPAQLAFVFPQDSK